MPNNQNTDTQEGDNEGDNSENEQEDVTAEQLKELRNEINEVKSDFNSVVGELKDERKKKREAREELKEVKGTDAESEESQDQESESKDVRSTVKEVLREERKDEIKQNRRNAEQAFKSRHKEFGDDADPGNVKMSAVEEQLQRFDLSDATTKDDFERAYEDAYRLAKKEESDDSGSSQNPYSSDPNAKDAPSPDTDDESLTQKEKALINDQGWSKEKFLEQKEKRPAYVESLLQ